MILLSASFSEWNPQQGSVAEAIDLVSHSVLDRERGGSVEECLPRDREAEGSSLTALWSFSKTHLS